MEVPQKLCTCKIIIIIGLHDVTVLARDDTGMRMKSREFLGVSRCLILVAVVVCPELVLRFKQPHFTDEDTETLKA